MQPAQRQRRFDSVGDRDLAAIAVRAPSSTALPRALLVTTSQLVKNATADPLADVRRTFSHQPSRAKRCGTHAHCQAAIMLVSVAETCYTVLPERKLSGA